jgi:hypothetical protein
VALFLLLLDLTLWNRNNLTIVDTFGWVFEGSLENVMVY